MSLSFKSGIGAVVIKSSNPLLSDTDFVVPSMKASCFGLKIRVNIYQISETEEKQIDSKSRWLKKTSKIIKYNPHLIPGKKIKCKYQNEHPSNE